MHALAVADSLSEFRKQLSSDGLLPVYIVQGEERHLVDEAVQAILSVALPDQGDAMSLTRVDLNEAGQGARDVIGACRSMG